MDIKVKDMVRVGIGRSSPFRVDNMLVKLEEMPNWEQFEREKKTIQVQKEVDAYRIVKMLGVYTPQVEMHTVNLLDGDRRFTTRATVREWQDLESFKSFTQICLAVPKIFHRIDFQYILITDFLIANYDRRPCNLLYDRAKDVLVPIDYDAAFSYDVMPCSIEGVKLLFSPYIENPVLSGMLDLDVQMFGEVYAYIKKQINFSLLKAIDERLIDRMLNAEDAFRKYLIEFSVGRISNEKDVETKKNAKQNLLGI